MAETTWSIYEDMKRAERLPHLKDDLMYYVRYADRQQVTELLRAAREATSDAQKK